MKKVYFLAIVLVMVFTLVSCSNASSIPNYDLTTNDNTTDSELSDSETVQTTDSTKSTLSIYEADVFFKTYYEIAAELAPDEISSKIIEQSNSLVFEETDNLRDFKFQCSDSVLHLYVNVLGESAGNVQVVQGVIRADDTAPYYLASLLSLHKGTTKEQAWSEATELISGINGEDGNTMGNSTYNTSIVEICDFYYLLTGYLGEYNGDNFYSERVNSNSSDLIAFATSNSNNQEKAKSENENNLEPIVYTGTGDDVLEIAPITEGYAFHITANQSSKHFAVHAYDASGNKLSLLVNTTDPYNGITLEHSLTTTMLEITATGDWTVELIPFAELPRISSGETITGNGDSVVIVNSFGTTATITGNKTSAHFAVKSYGSTRDNLMVNTTDVYEGTVILEGDPILLEVTAKGDWSITFN